MAITWCDDCVNFLQLNARRWYLNGQPGVLGPGFGYTFPDSNNNSFRKVSKQRVERTRWGTIGSKMNQMRPADVWLITQFRLQSKLYRNEFSTSKNMLGRQNFRKLLMESCSPLHNKHVHIKLSSKQALTAIKKLRETSNEKTHSLFLNM